MNNILSEKYSDLDLVAKENSDNYNNNKPFPHIVFENFFSESFLENVLEEFPDLSKSKDSEEYKSKNEVKFSNNNYSTFEGSTKKFVDFLNSNKFLKFLENLTSIKEKLLSDPHLMGGGLHEIKRGGVLKIHTDFNRHPFLPLDRRLNLLVYLNKNWSSSYGGELELWDKEMQKAEKKISPIFNKIVIFSTNDFSNHGHPEPLNCPKHLSRKSIALYYFSSGRPASDLSKKNYKNTTRFKNRFGVKNDIFEKNEKFKDFLRSFKFYQFLKNFEKKYIRRKKN
tara:strand:+ start:263 stop:1108 length:846 start_codon:yes stop_codon:yes gene_type:complete